MEDAAKRLDKLSLKELDELDEALLGFASIAELNKWLIQYS